MEKEKIRNEIAIDLRGKPSRTPDSLISEISRNLNLGAETISNQLYQMKDLGFIVPVGQASIRLSETGEQYYFSTKNEKINSFLKHNWPHILSNSLALFAVIISIISLLD